VSRRAADAAAAVGVSKRRTLGTHRARVWQLSSSANGRMLASASGDGTVKLWHVDRDDERDALAHTFDGHKRCDDDEHSSLTCVTL
jgi:WD40 repeat protein